MFRIFSVLVVATLTIATFNPTLFRFTPMICSINPLSLSFLIRVATEGCVM